MLDPGASADRKGMDETKPRLLLHVGAPKTGTTTLQHACYASREALLACGILYPDVDLYRGAPPKHQWLTKLVLDQDFEQFARNVTTVAEQARVSRATRVILSTEGLFNHWFDFSVAGRSALATLNDSFDVRPWVVFREPVSWAMSLYVQAVKNKRFHLAVPNSTSEPPEAAIAHEYFATRLRYDYYVQDVERVFGEGTVHVIRYESGDIVEQVRRFLGVDATVLASAGNRNKTLSALGVELLRRLNSLETAAEERQRIVKQIIELDKILGATSGPIRPSGEFRSKVLALSRESECYLEQRFGIGWADCRGDILNAARAGDRAVSPFRGDTANRLPAWREARA
jgi:hypothetical protein